MTNIVKNPTYKDKVPVINKVTIAPGEEREVTLLLQPHVGTEGRRKDGEIINYVMSLQDDLTEVELVQKFTSDPDMLRVAAIVLDLDDDDGAKLMESFTLWDIVNAFRDAIPYRTQQVQNPQVQEALKKLRGGNDSEPTT